MIETRQVKQSELIKELSLSLPNQFNRKAPIGKSKHRLNLILISLNANDLEYKNI